MQAAQRQVVAARAPGAASMHTSWCLWPWTLGKGATEILSVEAGAKAAVTMKIRDMARRRWMADIWM